MTEPTLDDDGDVAAFRQELVNELKNMGVITTPIVEAAFLAVPRHLFVPGIPLEQVYKDQVIITKKIDGEPVSSCEQPAIVAVLLEQLGLEPGQRVLEIGAGTGHTAALIAHIVGETGRVISLDIDPDLVTSAREHLSSAGLDRVQVVCADGWAGYPNAAPYDRILLTVASWDLAPAWREQLRPGGLIVLPFDITHDQQKSVAFEQVGDHLESLSVRECRFMHLRGESAPWSESRSHPLGPEPGLYIATADKHEIDRDGIYRWLTGPSQEWFTGIRVRPGELGMGLGFWLAVCAPEYCYLVAEGEMADRDIAPVLRFSAEEPKWNITYGLLTHAGLALLAYRRDQLPFPVDGQRMSQADLYVRSYGADETIARRLVEQVKAWDSAGRLSGAGLRVRAYPLDREYVPAANELLIRKQWTQLVLDWPR